MEYTWLGIAAAVFLLLSCIIGYKRGFIKEAISACFVLLSLILVWLVQPYVNTFVSEYTPVYTKMEQSCEQYLNTQIEQTGITNITTESIIEQALPLPENFKSQLLKSGQFSDAALIDTASCTKYVSEKVAERLVNAISFLLSYLAISLVLGILAKILNLISHLPVVRNVNRFAGLLLGGFKGLLFIWLVLLVMTVACNLSWGKQCMDMIDKDTFLQILYGINPFIKINMLGM